MASKTGKKANAAMKGKNNAPVEKDDGTRWQVVRDGKPVYLTNGGLTKAQAERLAAGMLIPAEIVQIS